MIELARRRENEKKNFLHIRWWWSEREKVTQSLSVHDEDKFSPVDLDW